MMAGFLCVHSLRLGKKVPGISIIPGTFYILLPNRRELHMFIKPTENAGLQSWSDDQLIRTYQKSKDQAYMAELYGRYVHLIYGACLKYLQDKEESKDLVMDLFEKILKTLPEHPIQSFKVWLYILIRNECNNRIRDRKVDQKINQHWQEGYEQTDFLAEQEQFREDEQQYKRERLVRKLIKKMSDQRRQCMQLFFYKGHSYKEIAQKLSLDTKQVKSHLQNGKRQLQQQLLNQQST